MVKANLHFLFAALNCWTVSASPVAKKDGVWGAVQRHVDAFSPVVITVCEIPPATSTPLADQNAGLKKRRIWGALQPRGYAATVTVTDFACAPTLKPRQEAPADPNAAPDPSADSPPGSGSGPAVDPAAPPASDPATEAPLPPPSGPDTTAPAPPPDPEPAPDPATDAPVPPPSDPDTTAPAPRP